MKKTLLCTALLVSSAIFAQTRKDSIKNIEQVEILVKKKLLERKADRMIFNVEASIASQGMDGTETLTNVPMIKVDESLGTISITGKSSVNIMINGRMLNLSGPALMNYLKSIRSENIARIEVITTPPARYEAQGNSGLINIILKKNPNIGFSGNMTSNLIQRTYSGFGNTGTVNYQNEKFSSSLKLVYYDSAKRTSENYDIMGTTQNYSSSIRRDMWNELTPSINMSYKITKNSEAGFEYMYAHQKSGMDIVNTTRNISPNFTEENLLTHTFHREKEPTHTVSAYYDLKLDSLGKKLSLTGNFYKNNSDTEVNFSTQRLSANTVEDVKTLSLVAPKIFSVQADLELPFSFGTIETGAKFNQFKNNSDLKYFNLTDNGYVADAARANLFQYQEKNYAAYFSYAKNFGTHWETKAGLRYERTVAESYTPSSGSGNSYRYGQWFPSAYVSYKKDKNIFSLSYSRRINRPGMGDLNPFRWYSNPYSYSSGNPLLTPSYINNLELTYTFNNKLTTSMYYLRVKNAFGQVSFQDGLSQVSTYLNYYNNNALGFNVSYTDTFFRCWESSVSANASYQDSDMFGVNAQTQKGASVSYSVNNTVTLNKNKTIALFLNYEQDLPHRSVNYYLYNFSNLSSGFKVSLMDKQLQINATVTNIFAQRYRGDIYFTDRVHHMNNYWDGRSFRLSVNYTFGSKKKIQKKDIKFEEKERAQ